MTAALACALRAVVVSGIAGTLTLPATAHAATDVKPARTWTGRVPHPVPPPLVSSVASPQAFRQVWALCQVKGDVPEIDFGTHLVLVAARRSSNVRFARLQLVDGDLRTTVVVAPDTPRHATCALALVPRAGIDRVDGAAPAR